MSDSIRPSTHMAEVAYLGSWKNVVPEFNENNWDHIATTKAEQALAEDGWTCDLDLPPDVDLGVEGFWTWGDLLVRIIPATILESRLYVFRGKGRANDVE